MSSETKKQITEAVRLIVSFLEDFVDENGDAKYKKIIDQNVEQGKVKFKLTISKKDMYAFDERLGQLAEKAGDFVSSVIDLYKQTRVLLLRGEVEGAIFLKDKDVVFLTKEYVNNIEGEEKPSLTDVAKYFGGYVMTRDGEQVIVTRFWKFALRTILAYIEEEANKQEKEQS
mgnify:CR=1 FL=1